MNNDKNPDKITKADLNLMEDVTVEYYDEWKDSQPDSPVPVSLRLAVRGAYDMQILRIAQGNRLFSHFRARLGLEASEKEDTDADAAKAITRLREEYEKVTEGVPGELKRRQFKATGVFHSFTEFAMVQAFMDMWTKEKAIFASLDVELKEIPVYNDFLVHVPGCGNALSGMLLSVLNPYRAPYASSFWRYLGLDVAKDGVGRGNRGSHNEPTWDKVKHGDGYRMVMTTRKTYNPEAKSKVMGVLSDTMLKAGLRWVDVTEEEYEQTPDAFRRMKAGKKKADPEVPQAAIMKNTYIERYLTYKHRKEHSVGMCKVWRVAKGDKTSTLQEIRWCDTSPAHRAMAAKRAMVKTMLADFWKAWRTSEGLPTPDPYAEAKLGMAPHHDRRDGTNG